MRQGFTYLSLPSPGMTNTHYQGQLVSECVCAGVYACVCVYALMHKGIYDFQRLVLEYLPLLGLQTCL